MLTSTVPAGVPMRGLGVACLRPTLGCGNVSLLLLFLLVKLTLPCADEVTAVGEADEDRNENQSHENYPTEEDNEQDPAHD